MTEQQKKDAIEYIEGQIANGYIDLGFHDEYELEIIKEAIDMWKTIDRYNNLGCMSFTYSSLTDEDIQAIISNEEREVFYEDVINDRIEKIECSVKDFKRLGYTDEQAEEIYKHISINK